MRGAGAASVRLAFRLRSLRGEIFALLTLAVPFILAALARINPASTAGRASSSDPGVPRRARALPGLPLPAEPGGGRPARLAVAFAMQHSRFGWALAAIRDAEDVAEGLGVATFRYKLLALMASAVIGGVGGSVFALQIGFVAVDSVFHLTIPLFVIVMSVLGGRTHWLGPVVGVVIVVLLQDRLTASGPGPWRLIVLGTILAALVIAAPDGLYARLRAGRGRVRRRRRRWCSGSGWCLASSCSTRILAGLLAAAVVGVWSRRGAASAAAGPPRCRRCRRPSRRRRRIERPDRPPARRRRVAAVTARAPEARDRAVLVECQTWPGTSAVSARSTA